EELDPIKIIEKAINKFEWYGFLDGWSSFALGYWTPEEAFDNLEKYLFHMRVYYKGERES
ncbi:MAG: hypothetical protein DRO67_10360, partial [Candidatus Asgardarchaeum californiense]